MSFKNKLTMDYKELYNKSQKELQYLNEKHAVVSAEIKKLVEELGLTLDETLKDQIESMHNSLKENMETAKVEIENLLKKLESVSTGDGTEDFE